MENENENQSQNQNENQEENQNDNQKESQKDNEEEKQNDNQNDNQSKKCSFEEHKEQDAKGYCKQCDKYICDNCVKYHQSFAPDHKVTNLDEEINEPFNGLCQLENHQDELNYYCQNHNELCCAKCIAKIKRPGVAQHTNCKVCNVEEIANEKRQNLPKNIELLEALSEILKSSNDEISELFEKIKKNKEQVKQNIKNVFTKIKNAINQKEKEILAEVDKQFETTFFNDSTLKDSEKLPEKVQAAIDKGKSINEEWDKNEKVNSLIYDCITIENYIRTMQKIKECNSNNITIKFNSDNGESLLQSIKQIGNLSKIIKPKIKNKININVKDFSPEGVEIVDKISNTFGNNSIYTFDGICFFVSKNNEYVLAYIDTSYKNIIFYDANNKKEIKRINNAHELGIYVVKYYEYYLYDMLLTSSVNNEVKLWNYNKCANTLTIKNIFNNNSYVFSSALLFDNNAFYVMCVGKNDYIKIYNSNGSLFKNLGNVNEFRRFIDIFDIDDNKYIITGGDKGINVFIYPYFENYHCFKEDKDTSIHNYAKLIKKDDVYNLIDVGESDKIRIWDFAQKTLIKCITSDTPKNLGGFITINNKYLIIGSWDKEVKIIDIDEDKIVRKLKEHTSYVMGIKALKDKNNCQYFVSYGGDNRINLWSLLPKK
jgi:WD40 repeat protein